MHYVIFLVIALVTPQLLLAKDSLNSQLSLEDARHLLNRTGFGASPFELNQTIGKTRAEAIDAVIEGFTTTPSQPMPAWTERPAPHHWSRNELSKTNLRKFNDSRDQEMSTLKLWWVKEMLETQSPQTERMILFWHDHFATGYSAINDQAISMARQHKMLRKYATGNFKTMLTAIIRDPAMLNYLNNDNSKKKSPNENLARELFELFTLGEGNYTEADIKNAARALTGYSVSANNNMSFQFKPYNHDQKEKTIFGHTGHFDGDDLIDLILQQPQAASFVPGKMWQMLIGPDAPTELQLKPIADKFLSSGFDIKTLYRALLESDDFWAAENRASLVRSPVSLTIGAIRSSGIVPGTWQTLPTTMRRLGQDLFDPPNVAGWTGGAAWITPGKLLNRLEWLSSVNTCDDSSCMQTATMQSSMSLTESAADSSANTMTGNQLTNGMTASAGTYPPEIKIRLAAEDYEGPVQYNINVINAEEILWSSGPTDVIGGHDTKRFGRAKLETERPWQTVTFPLNNGINEFDAIEVEFLNDHAKNGGDRNLYIKWVALDGKLFNATEGVQNSRCPPQNKVGAGNLYCQGKVRLTQAAPVAAPQATTLPADTLKASNVYAWGAENADRPKRSTLTLALIDVEFDGRKWHNLEVKYVKEKNDHYRIRLNNHHCWPDCIDHWPGCSWLAKDNSGRRSLTIDLVPQKNENCQYTDLTASDRKLIDALWRQLPGLYRQASGSKRLKKDARKSKFDTWAPHVARMSAQFQQSPYTTSGSKLLIASPPVEPMDMNDQLTGQPPLAAGRSESEWQSDLDTLLRKLPDLTLQTLLLPTKALNEAATDDSSPASVLTDLAFQLY